MRRSRARLTFSSRAMNPDKLFDYLDGKLAPAERQELEEKLMSDTQLRRQFNVAREIHRASGGSREVIVPPSDPAALERSGVLGRRIAIACVALVFLNVVIGLAVIVGKNKKKPEHSARENAMRQQLSTSLGAAAQNAMPPPSFVAQDIQITAPRAEWEKLASRVIAAASSLGGDARRALPEPDRLTLLADIPSSRESDFRQAITGPAAVAASPSPAAPPAASGAQPNERTIVQVRIAEAAR